MGEHRNLIAGEWIGGDFRANISPSDLDDTVGHYAQATEADVDRAIDAASTAQPGWWALADGERASILDRIGTTMLRRADELGELLAREEGKTRREAVGEVTRAANTFRYYAQQIMQPTGEVYPSSRAGVSIDVLRRPIGVVGIITPWNYPLAIPAWKIAPALAYGNAVVFKPAELVPASAWELASIIHSSGMPAGVFNLVMGSGAVVGQRMIESPHIAGITFTGSGTVGDRIAADALRHGRKKVQLELGGKNPLVVLDDADIDVAVQVALDGSFFSTGQRCTASSRLIVEDGIHDEFAAKLATAVSDLTVGHALDEDTVIGPVASDAQRKQDLDYIAIGRAEGAEVLAGGSALERPTVGYYLEPTLFVGGTSDMRINQEEIFGPVSCIIRVDGYDRALAVANDTPYGLSAGIVTRSLAKSHHFRRHVDAGIISVNQSTAVTELQAPFGGVKGSSYGSREQGPNARDFFTSLSTGYTIA